MHALVLLLLWLELLYQATGQLSVEPCALPRRNLTSCNNAVDIALGDDRISGEKPNQCRVGCRHFSHKHIAMSIRPANCAFDLCDVPRPFRTFSFGDRMCQPRAMCVAACGEEPPGCVYSGSCRELTCFTDKNTRRPADFTRISFAGPRTIVRVNDSYTTDETELNVAFDAVLESRDLCGESQYYHTFDSVCRQSKDVFLSDRRADDNSMPGQCRTACRNLHNDNVEIVRMRTGCNACDSRNDSYLCIPQAECHEKCASPYSRVEGCVFTGTCQSLVCVSGIDSKLAAVLNITDETGSEGAILSVDNETPPLTLDPPIFVKFLEDVQVPNARVPAITGITLGEASNTTSPQVQAAFEIEQEQMSKWVWLGPTIGLVGTILTAIAALIAAYISRKGTAVLVSPQTSNDSKIQLSALGHEDTRI
ncbi:unnamed protein product [Agarophyton chilense]|eukprot:gb/GEZJ01000940.1/.p1 GENE.gb/GEZJ01000940.1/~~gb/GEZJ01000940.1/.p1  ORF type:complete len:422 (-),score=32.56 gb/GEZJ01000940.1/:2399-3664(-)